MAAKPRNIPPLAFIGPSGCGKTSLLKELLRRKLVMITPTWTDRPPRPGEAVVEHQFVTAQEFTSKVETGLFLEVVQPFGLPFRYGMPQLPPESDRVSVVMVRAPFVEL